MKTKNYSLGLILNIICAFMTIWFTYKHYFKNEGKGIDDIFYVLSLLSFINFFSLKASLNLTKSNQTYKTWLIFGIGYILAIALFIELELFHNLYWFAIIPIGLFITTLYMKSPMQMMRILETNIYLGLILAILPAYSFLLIILSCMIELLKAS